MVDNADTIITLWNPKVKKGGTYYTLQYAKRQQKPIYNFWNE